MWRIVLELYCRKILRKNEKIKKYLHKNRRISGCIIDADLKFWYITIKTWINISYHIIFFHITHSFRVMSSSKAFQILLAHFVVRYSTWAFRCSITCLDLSLSLIVPIIIPILPMPTYTHLNRAYVPMYSYWV